MTENETKSSSEETRTDTKSETQEKSPESLLSSVRSVSTFAATAGQMPVEITGFRDDPVYQSLIPTVWATPVDPVDGGDGSHTTVQSKEDDYVWKPFVAPDSWPMESDFNSDGTIWNDTPYGQTQNTANDTATVASNSLTKF